MYKLAPISCILLVLVAADGTLPEIEPIGKVPRSCRKRSFRKMKRISLAFLNALNTCFNDESGDALLDVYSRNSLVFGASTVLVGRDQFAATFVLCKRPPPRGVKGLQFAKILESIVGNSVYYLFTTRAPGFLDYNSSFSITVCRSKIVRTVATLNPFEIVPISALSE